MNADASVASTLLFGALAVAQVLIALAMACAVIRLLAGPRAQDRVLALDTLYVNAMLLMLAFGMREATPLYFEIALVIGMLGFVSTAALARFLLRGEVIE
jgi:multicomponent K+:H+ antiporter subunit F